MEKRARSTKKGGPSKETGDMDIEEERKLVDNIETAEEKEKTLKLEQASTLRKVETYEEAFAIIRDATGVKTFDDMVEKFVSQAANRAALEEEKAEALRREAEVEALLRSIQKEFAEVKAAGIGGSELNRELYDQLDERILRTQIELKKNEEKRVKITKLLLKAKAGMSGLLHRMSPYRYPADTGNLEAKEETEEEEEMELVKIIRMCENISCKMLEEIQAVQQVTGTDTLETELWNGSNSMAVCPR